MLPSTIYIMWHAPDNFKVAMSNSSVGDAFTRKRHEKMTLAHEILRRTLYIIEPMQSLNGLGVYAFTRKYNI